MRNYSFHDTYKNWILIEEMLPKIPGRYLVTVEVYKNETITYMANFNNGEFEYSCAMKSHFRKSGNQMSGKWKSSCASLLA